MREFLAQYEHTNDNKINQDMFDRAFDRPLYEYIVDTCKNLEVIPAITLESWEFITDQTKIRSVIDRRLSKDPKIRNNTTLERLAQPNRSLNDLLVLHFRVKAKGRDERVTRRVLILKEIAGNRYIKGGKVVLPLIQVVDNSTFVKGNILKFKTALYPIDLSLIKHKITFTNGKSYACPAFRLNLFKKLANPLLYYLAHFGLERTISFFHLEDVISVVDRVIDKDNYYYARAGKDIYVEVNKLAFVSHEFIPKFVGSLHHVIESDSDVKFKDLYDISYWLERLSELVAKKRLVSKGERTLISFEKLMGPTARKRLVLRKDHKRNTYTIVRWMMTNYPDLIKKDSHDLRNKRVRANECQAYYFDNYITRNVYSLLNTDNPPFEKYLRLLNSIGEYTLLRVSQGGKGGSATSMYRYERYNDFDAIDLSRYTFKGPTGLNGGKNGVNQQYRDIYVSHLGRFDLNVCSSSDPGLTGYLTANVKIDKNGYFDNENCEPDNYDPVIAVITEKYAEKGYARHRHDYIGMTLSRDEVTGFIKLKRKKTAEEMTLEFQKNPYEYGLYPTNTGLRLIPKMVNKDPKGFARLLKRKRPNRRKREVDIRDENGFLELVPVKLKINTSDKYRR